eukprot:136564-Hanusia_phi.AAC.1
MAAEDAKRRWSFMALHLAKRSCLSWPIIFVWSRVKFASRAMSRLRLQGESRSSLFELEIVLCEEIVLQEHDFDFGSYAMSSPVTMK